MTRFRWGGHERMIAADNALKRQIADDMKKIAARRASERPPPDDQGEILPQKYPTIIGGKVFPIRIKKKEVKEDVVSKMNAAARKEARNKKKANTVTQDTLSYLTTNAVKEKEMKKKEVKEETIPIPLEYGGEYSIRNIYEISKEKTKQYISAAEDDRDETYIARRDPDYYSSSYRGSGDPEGKAEDDRILKNRRAGIKLAKKKLKEWLEEEQLDEAQIGHRVKIIQPKFGGSMKEFHGKTGTVTGIEKDGSTNMYRVELDDPVDIPGVGKVSDDLWAGQHLKKIK